MLENYQISILQLFLLIPQKISALRFRSLCYMRLTSKSYHIRTGTANSRLAEYVFLPLVITGWEITLCVSLILIALSLIEILSFPNSKNWYDKCPILQHCRTSAHGDCSYLTVIFSWPSSVRALSPPVKPWRPTHNVYGTSPHQIHLYYVIVTSSPE